MSQPGICPICDVPADPGAKLCGRCGVPLAYGSARQPPAHGAWYHSLWVVLFLLLFVLGPFGLPLVWKNPRLSATAKWLLTLLMAGYAIALIVMVAGLIQAMQASINNANAAFEF